MMDLIDRQAAINAIRNAVTKECAEWVVKELPSAQPNLQPTCNQLATDCISRQAALRAVIWNSAAYNAINMLPSARKKGTWQRVTTDRYVSTSSYVFKCDQCGEEVVRYWNFCPNCGADMRGE